MGMLKEDINDLIDSHGSRGIDLKKIATRLVEAGLRMMSEEGDITTANHLYLTNSVTGGFEIGKRPIPAAVDTFEQGGLADITSLIGRKPRDGERIVITIDQDGRGFTTEYQGVDIERSATVSGLIGETAELLNGYAELHLAKVPPDTEKAGRNSRQAAKLYEVLGMPYSPPSLPETQA